MRTVDITAFSDTNSSALSDYLIAGVITLTYAD